MMHLAAYYESQVTAGVLIPVAAVPDQSIFTSGDDVRIPTDLTSLLWEAALTASTAPTGAQLQSPSLRDLANRDIQPVVAAVVFGGYPEVQEHIDNPIKLVGYESLNFAVNATDASAAVTYGLVCLADGAAKAVQGDIFTVQATGAAALSAGVWVNTPLTFNTTLPSGQYQVVGLRAMGANMVAARLVFIGQAYRPGVPAVNAVGNGDWFKSRYGKLGVFGQFDINQPPTMDCLGVTDTVQTFVLDLIKVK